MHTLFKGGRCAAVHRRLAGRLTSERASRTVPRTPGHTPEIAGVFVGAMPMTRVEALFLATYFLVLLVLAIYGAHRYVMAYLFYKYKGNLPVPAGRFAQLPRVTIQFPIFNEMYVVERLIEAVCRIDYPRDRLEIQVLDDSTDETQGIARAAVERSRRAGHDISYMRRDHRDGFKAGALQEGLLRATGEYVAVFDADFVPGRDFLSRSVQFFTDPRVG